MKSYFIDSFQAGHSQGTNHLLQPEAVRVRQQTEKDRKLTDAEVS